VRILITGAGGLLGGRLCDLLSTDHELTGAIRHQPAPPGIPVFGADLADKDAVGNALRVARPEVVIHCAALADPEVCERDAARAERDNVNSTLALATASAQTGARFILVSTDLVFDGRRALSSESASAEPLMEYGRSKRRAEAAAALALPDSVILRTSLICGRGYGPRWSASETIARKLRLGETVRLYEDEWRTPVDPESIASAIRALLNRPRMAGTFHIAGAERVTRVELGERVAAACELDASLIERTSRSTHVGAPRPRDVSLDTRRAREELGWAPRSLDEALREGRRA